MIEPALQRDYYAGADKPGMNERHWSRTADSTPDCGLATNIADFIRSHGVMVELKVDEGPPRALEKTACVTAALSLTKLVGQSIRKQRRVCGRNSSRVLPDVAGISDTAGTAERANEPVVDRDISPESSSNVSKGTSVFRRQEEVDSRPRRCCRCQRADDPTLPLAFRRRGRFTSANSIHAGA